MCVNVLEEQGARKLTVAFFFGPTVIAKVDIGMELGYVSLWPTTLGSRIPL